ncbi:enoyl-CoA hydratase-related protein (plasmid) [Agrobacterium leguminum]|nr:MULTISPECIES: enoyl-CoA hydratase-related protein [Agrobacterium]WFS69820.1 enoyl-CoA hydratase-related protein [Agrobacterium leguminum]
MTINLSRDENIALLEISRPEALNALNLETIQTFTNALDTIETWTNLKALIITGAGEKSFCAGADVKELSGRTLANHREGVIQGQRAFARLDSFRLPSIAAINGFAFGGGLEIALACTFRVAKSNAKLGLPEIRLGLIPGYGGTQRLARLIGTGRALELILTGKNLTGSEARDWGLVNAVTDQNVVDAAKQFASGFTAHSLPILGYARDAINRGVETTLANGLVIEADACCLAYSTQDAAEGIAAFTEKRSPSFLDR